MRLGIPEPVRTRKVETRSVGVAEQIAQSGDSGKEGEVGWGGGGTSLCPH